ncbi:hypothetical protein PpBr36_04984 [Pyricularia pennisetigena]|uniref:hypothetical protein n=1 Tax=Pyricularia pennisetigena TaxID=1578925 RepID=UPI001154958D|nr:hypothetical protein PpBr36_04984 [Pyricularia pennisetigena]TLS26131.1 hypothetical protein PpBr36_04984 [Pyricularia pennisetigena]
MLGPLLLAGATSLATATTGAMEAIIPPQLRDILSNATSNPLYQYPTSLTQDIIPKGMHSHNDYWRPVPFYSGLAHGAISTEADVWLYGDELHVGHDRSSLTEGRTFDSLYVQPILSVLKRQNPSHRFVGGGEATKYGVFDTDPGQTLYLFVDVKTNGAETWPVVVKALQPLRDAGFLTVFNGNTTTQGAVTVVGTGNTPRGLVQGVSPRDYFWDAPLARLADAEFANVTANESPIASTSFNGQWGDTDVEEGRRTRRTGKLNEAQMAQLEAQVKAAHDKGMLTRYWDTPGWPVRTRNAVWRTLWDAGCDLLNVDDLGAAVEFWEQEVICLHIVGKR